VTTDRESFLQRVRQAVAEGNRAGGAPTLPERGNVGYQGGGGDPLARLRDEVAAAGGTAHLVADAAGAVAAVLEVVVRQRSARRVLLGDGAFLQSLGLEAKLSAQGVEVRSAATLGADSREAFFAADVGITGADALVAETGTVALESRPDQPRGLSLLPPVHIVVAKREQVVGDLFDLFTHPWQGGQPACLSLITGPSKTGDIELKLVTGVHGPGELHVVVVTG
jgi:L-lactate utilization protein LutC